MELTEFDVRLWCRFEMVEAYTEQVIKAMEARGFTCTSRSRPLTCRPPRQYERRVMLTFKIKGDSHDQ